MTLRAALLPALGLAAALALSACAARPAPAPPLGATFLPCPGEFLAQNGTRLSPDELLDMAGRADYLLVGEGHKNPCDHQVQATLVKALAESGRPLAIGLEMVARDKQDALDAFARGEVRVDGLEERLDWGRRWGYPFAMFRPIFELAERHSLPVAGLNAPPDIVRKASRQGLDALSAGERGQLPLTVIPQPPDQEAALTEAFVLHQGRDREDRGQLERFFLIQSLWDTQMALSAVDLRARYGWPVLVIAGEAHVEHGWGLARRIAMLDPGAGILLIMPWRGLDFDPGSGEAFFFCPNSYVSRMGMVLEERVQGLTVVRVEPGSRADKAGLRPGDLIVKAQGRPLDSLMGLHLAGSEAFRDKEPLVFTLRRGGKTLNADLGLLGAGR